MPTSVIGADRNHVNVPSLDDIAALQVKVSALTARVEQLEALADGRDIPDDEPISATSSNEQSSQD